MGLLSAEWLKVRSVRSTWYILGVAAACVLFAAVWAWYVGHLWDTAPAGQKVRQAAPGEHLAKTVVPFAMAVFGVLAVTSEYATGLIRTTLTTRPRRLRVLLAKVVVVAAGATVTGLVAMFGAFFVARRIMGDRPIEGYRSSASVEVPALVAASASVLVLALIGLGLGAAFRSTAAALAVVVGMVFVLPTVVRFMPTPWDDRLSSVLLPALPEAWASQPADAGVLSPQAAVAAMVAYVVVAVGLGAVALQRRDV